MFWSPNAALVNQIRSKWYTECDNKISVDMEKMLQKNPRTPKNEKEFIGMAFVCDALVFY